MICAIEILVSCPNTQKVEAPNNFAIYGSHFVLLGPSELESSILFTLQYVSSRAPRSGVKECPTVHNYDNDVLTTAARLCPYLSHSYVTAATEATKVPTTCEFSNCRIWSMAGRSKFMFS